MNTSYELLDLVSGNVFDVYERESDALDVLIEIDLEHGHEAVKRFALLRDVDDQTSLVAMEDDLVERVQVEKESLVRVERATKEAVSPESGSDAAFSR